MAHDRSVPRRPRQRRQRRARPPDHLLLRIGRRRPVEVDQQPAAPGSRCSTARRSRRSAPSAWRRPAPTPSTSARAKPTCASQIGYGDGMYKSTDGGRTWTHIGLEATRQIGRVIVDPKDPNVVFVAALGHVYGANPDRGVYRSRDGGATWQKVLFSNDNVGAIDLAFDSLDSHIIYASLWNTRRPPWSIYPPSYGPGGGLYKSDGRRRGLAAPDQRPPVRGARAHRHRRRAHRPKPRLRDRGRQGRRPLSLRRRGRRPGRRSRPTRASGAAAGTSARSSSIRRTRTSSTCRIRPSTGRPTPADLDGDQRRAGRRRLPPALDRAGRSEPHDSRERSGRGRERRRREDVELLVQPADGAALPRGRRQPLPVLGDRRAAGQRRRRHADAQRARGDLRARMERPVRRRRERLHGARPAASRRSSSAAPSRAATSSPARRRTCRPSTTCRRRRGIPGRCRSCSRRPIRTRSTSADQFLFKTTDGGGHWTRISDDLTREDPGVPPNLDPATAADAPEGKRRGVIYTIAPSPVRAPLIWVGTDDGLIKVTSDDGKTWRT